MIKKFILAFFDPLGRPTVMAGSCFCTFVTCRPSIRPHFSKLAKQTSKINDPLGQTHSLASNEHCFRFALFCFARF